MCHDNEEWYKIWIGIDLSFQNWHEELDEFWPEHSKISKICALMGFFWTKYIMFNPKKYRGVMFGSTEYWCNIWRKTDLSFQKWHEEFRKFSPEHVRKSKNGNLDGIFLSKVETVCASNLQGSFLSWQWRMIPNLNRNWLVSLKLTWGIWQILTRALENLKNLNFNAWAKKSIEELCLMTLKTDAKFEGKLTSVL